MDPFIGPLGSQEKRRNVQQRIDEVLRLKRAAVVAPERQETEEQPTLEIPEGPMFVEKKNPSSCCSFGGRKMGRRGCGITM